MKDAKRISFRMEKATHLEFITERGRKPAREYGKVEKSYSVYENGNEFNLNRAGVDSFVIPLFCILIIFIDCTVTT